MDLHRLLDQRGEPPLDDLLLAHPLLDARGLGLRVAGEVGERGQDTPKLLERRVVLADVLGEGIQPVREDLRIGIGIDGEPGARVPQEERPVGELELELTGLEDAPVLIRKHGKEDLVAELGLRRVPVHVEDGGPGRARAVLQHVQPPRIGIPRDPHVIGHEVEDDSEAATAEVLDHAIERGRAAHLRIEGVVVRDVVAVGAARAALEAR